MTRSGKLTIWERLKSIFDPKASFLEERNWFRRYLDYWSDARGFVFSKREAYRLEKNHDAFVRRMKTMKGIL